MNDIHRLLIEGKPEQALVLMAEYIKTRNLKIECPDYSDHPNRHEYLQQNLKGGTGLLNSMFTEMYTLVPGCKRHKQLIEALDSAILGWVETWICLNL